jgi:hypothetical protein
MILLDTNVLTRMSSAGHPQHTVLRQALTALRRQGEHLALVPQNL